MIKTYLKRWWNKTKNSFINNLPLSIITLLLIPFFVIAIATVLASYGTVATIAYTISCLWKLDRLLEKFWRVIVWGVGYLIGTLALRELITKLPELSRGEGISLFTGFLILSIILFAYWLKKR